MVGGGNRPESVDDGGALTRRRVLAAGAAGLAGGAAALLAACTPGAPASPRPSPLPQAFPPGSPPGPGAGGDPGAPSRPEDTVVLTERETLRRAESPLHELRAFWLASVNNTDWPSRAGLSVAQQRGELIDWLELARANRFNAVVMQVRPAADTFWPSGLEPWSKYLTGRPGADPGWDPLGTAVAEAHARGLQLHAWFNPGRAGLSEPLEDLAAGHPARLEPAWSYAYAGRRYLNPGIPEVRRHVQEVVLEAVRGYDLDAVHLDDNFYPFPVPGWDIPDGAQWRQHGLPGEALPDFRRRQVSTLVGELGQRLHAERTHLLFGLSAFGIWRNAATDPAGSRTGGLQGYDALYVDTLEWVRSGLIDYVTPQLYWPQGYAVADYAVLLPWWASQLAGARARLFIGEAVNRVGVSGAAAAWQRPTELTEHLELARASATVSGTVYFSAGSVRSNRLGAMTEIIRRFYAKAALPPAFPGRGGAAPPAPEGLTVRSVAEGARLDWEPTATESCAVFRFEGVPGTPPWIPSTAEALLAVVPAGENSFVDTGPQRGKGYWYLLMAVSRTGIEAVRVPAVYFGA